MKDELGVQTVKEFVGLRAKIYSQIKDNNDEDKTAKGTKKCAIKRKLKFEDYKNCVEVAQIKNEIKSLEKKNKIDGDNLKELQREFIKRNKLILKTQQRFKSRRYNVFTEEINKIVLSCNDDKRMQSIDSIETYAYAMKKIQDKILIVEGSGSGKTNVILNLINNEPDFDKFLYAKDPYEAKY